MAGKSRVNFRETDGSFNLPTHLRAETAVFPPPSSPLERMWLQGSFFVQKSNNLRDVAGCQPCDCGPQNNDLRMIATNVVSLVKKVSSSVFDFILVGFSQH